VIPQFTEASTEAKTSSLCTDLQSVRSQIELYKIQHNDNLPGVANGLHTGASGFVAALIGYTDIFGVTQAAAGPNVYGPYLQKVPMNQFVNLDTIRIDGAAPGAATHGWQFNTATGAFHADTAAHAAL
jgi:general secretion pathway protein G